MVLLFFMIILMLYLTTVSFDNNVNHGIQHCNWVTSIDSDDPLTHWLRPSDLDIMTQINIEIYIATGCSQDWGF